MKNNIILSALFFGLANLVQAQTLVKDFTNFEAVNSANSDFGFIPAGNKTVFTSNRKDFKKDHGYYKIYQYDVAQSKLQRLVNIPAKYNAGPACSIQGSTDMIVSLNKPINESEGQKALMELWRVSSKGKLTRLKINGKDFSCMHPSISQDGKYLFFASNKTGGIGGYDLYKSELMADGQLGEMINLGAEINSSGNDVFPVLSKEGQLSYASDKSGGLGSFDVYLAFPDKSGKFRYSMHPTAPVNSAQDDFYLYLDTDKAYLASNRDGGKGDDDIYSMNLEKPFSPFSTFTNLVLLDSSGAVQPNKKIVVKDRLGEIVQETQTNEKGEYNLTLISDEPNQITLDNQFNRTIEPGKNFKSEMLVVPAEKALVKGSITDESGSKLTEANVAVMDAQGNVVVQTLTDADGNYQLSYLATKGSTIKASKQGYTENSKNLVPSQKSQELMLSLASKNDLNLQVVIYFKTASDRLDRKSKQSLDSLAMKIKANPEAYKVVLNGHSDYTGSENLNLRLSQQRAESCSNYLLRKGLTKEIVNTQSFGESRSVNACVEGTKCSDEELAKNRRVEVALIKK